MKPYYVYILRLSGGSLYTGITTDPERRFRQHRGEIKGGAKATKINAPVKLECVFEAADRSAASKLEYSLKRLSHIQKEKIISGEAGVPPEYRRVAHDSAL